MGVVLLAAAAALLVGVATSLPAGSAESTSDPAAAAPGAPVELVEERTEHSRTFRSPDGFNETTLSIAPLNYRDAAGRWQPIDSTLERQADGSLENAAGDFAIAIPEDAAGEVSVSEAGHELGFSLLGASEQATAQADGSEATFDAALPGVSVVYEAKTDGLKETLVLADAQAPSRFEYALDAPGLTAALQPSGDVAFADGGGTVRFTLAAPWMQDAAGALSGAAAYELSTVDGTQRLTLRVDEAWLRDPARVFPIAIDPTVSGDPEGMCNLRSGTSANASSCANAMPLWVGRSGSTVHRAAIAMPSTDGALPDRALVIDSRVEYELASRTSSARTRVALHALTRDIGPGATWNRASSSTSWTTPGGDFQRAYESEDWMADDMVGDRWEHTNVRYQQREVQNRPPSNGLLLKASDESLQHVDVLEDVTLSVRWHHRTGFDAHETFEHLRLPGDMSADVALASGNLVLTSRELGLRGYRGRPLTDRHLNTNGLGYADLYGTGEEGDFGSIAIEEHPDGNRLLYGYSGLEGVFVPRADGTYDPPPGLTATLRESEDDVYTIFFEDTMETWTFSRTEPHRLVRAEDAYGYSISGEYDEQGRIERLTGEDGHWIDYDYDGSFEEVEQIEESDGRVHRYGYDAGGDLIAYTDPGGLVTRLTRDGDDRVSEIEWPDGRELEIDYHSNWYPAELRLEDAELDPIETIAFDGDDDFPAWASVDRNGEPTRRYDYTQRGLFASSLRRTPTAATTVTLGGRLAAGADTTLAPGTHPLTIAAGDPGGVARIDVEVDGFVERSWTWDCTAGCPAGQSATWNLNTADFPPGEHVVRAIVTARGGEQRAQAIAVVVPHTGLSISPRTRLQPTIAGRAADGETLTASISRWVGDHPMRFQPQWRRCNPVGAACQDIAGENRWHYTATGADVGSTLVVTARGRNHRGVGTTHSAAFGPIAGAPPANAQAPEILGRPTAGDRVLVADDGVWRGTAPVTLSYQWETCTTSAPSSCSVVPDAWQGTYEVPSAFDGWMRLTVTALNPHGTAAASSPLRRVRTTTPPQTGDVGFTGTARVGSVLTATVPDPGVSWGAQWMRCDAEGRDCRPIGGATGSRYLVTTEDLGHRLRLRVVYEGGQSHDDSAHSAVVRGALLAPRRMALVLDGEELWTDAVGGGDPREMLSVSYADDLVDLAVSPDGDTVALVTSRGIELVGADGRGRRLLLEAPSSGGSGSGLQSPSSVAFSPAGDKLVFGAYSPVDFATGIFSIEIATAAVARLDAGWSLDVPYVDRELPSWSPRGDRLAYVARNGSQTAIVLAAADATGETAIEVGYHVEEGSIGSKPRFSEDGGEVIFSGRPLGDACGEAIHGIDVATLELTLRSHLRNCDVGLTLPSWTGPGADVLVASSDDESGGGLATRVEQVELGSGEWDEVIPNTGKPITALELPQTSVPAVAVDAAQEGRLYGNGVDPLQLAVMGSDRALGIQGFGYGPSTAAPTGTWTATCDSLCPPELSHEFAVATGGLPEGATPRVVWAQNAAGTLGTADVELAIDRTAPVPITAPGVHASDATAQTATITWGTAYDPDLPGDVPGAGVVRQEYRWHTAAAGWSAWVDGSDGSAEVTSVATNATITVEARATDAVGNATTASRTVDWNPPPPDPDEQIGGIDWGPPGGFSTFAVTCDGLYDNGRDATSAPATTDAFGEQDVVVFGRAWVHCYTRTRVPRSPRVRFEICVMVQRDVLGFVPHLCRNYVERGGIAQGFGDVSCLPDTATYQIRLRWWRLPVLRGDSPVTEPSGDSRSIACNNPGAWRANARYLATRPGRLDETLLANVLEAGDRPPRNADGGTNPGLDDNGFVLRPIIALTSPEATRLQGLAWRCGLQPTHWYNGVWLRGEDLQDADDGGARRSDVGYKRLGPIGRGRPYVHDVQGEAYRTAIYDRLEEATRPAGGCDTLEAGQIMSDIKEDIEDGEVPGRRVAVDEIASTYRPLLHFDGAENWRPLQIDRFFSEGRLPGVDNHDLCHDGSFPVSDCREIDGWRDLRSSPSDRRFIGISGDTDERRSPRDGCVVGTVWDCDRGPNTALYWHVVDDGRPYRYFGYWSFYRYNRYRSATSPDLGDHEGDWESVSIAVRKNDPYTFDFATFAGHRNRHRYLRGVLSCDGEHRPGTCGTEREQRGRRLDVYVANGSHAAYPQRCDEESVEGGCRRTDPENEPGSERGFDGTASWGANDQASALRRFPPARGGWDDERETATWVDWPGRWGEPTLLDGAPESPGVRGVYRRPWEGDCTERWANGGDCDDIVVIRGSAAREAPASPRDAACAPWQGPFVQVSICDPEVAERSLREGLFAPQDAPARITGLRSDDAVGAAGGIMQLAGRPLAPGDEVRLTVENAGAVDLVVQASDPARALESHFEDVALRKGQQLTVSIDDASPRAELEVGARPALRPDAVLTVPLR